MFKFIVIIYIDTLIINIYSTRLQCLRESLCILQQKTNNETLIAMKNIAMRILVLFKTVHSYKTKSNTIFPSQGFP